MDSLIVKTASGDTYTVVTDAARAQEINSASRSDRYLVYVLRQYEGSPIVTVDAARKALRKQNGGPYITLYADGIEGTEVDINRNHIVSITVN